MFNLCMNVGYTNHIIGVNAESIEEGKRKVFEEFSKKFPSFSGYAALVITGDAGEYVDGDEFFFESREK